MDRPIPSRVVRSRRRWGRAGAPRLGEPLVPVASAMRGVQGCTRAGRGFKTPANACTLLVAVQGALPQRGPLGACAEVTLAVGKASAWYPFRVLSCLSKGGGATLSAGLEDTRDPRRHVCWRPALRLSVARPSACTRGCAHPPRQTSGRLTLFSRPSMTSMPLWLRYSSCRFTRLCRPSILVSRLLWEGEPTAVTSGGGRRGNSFWERVPSLAFHSKGARTRLPQREKGQRFQPAVLGYSSRTRG